MSVMQEGGGRRRRRAQLAAGPGAVLPIVEAHRCALLAEHGGQKRYGEIPQLTNAKIHRHRVALGAHASPAINTPTGASRAARSGRKVAKSRIVGSRTDRAPAAGGAHTKTGAAAADPRTAAASAHNLYALQPQPQLIGRGGKLIIIKYAGKGREGGGWYINVNSPLPGPHVNKKAKSSEDQNAEFETAI